MRKFKPGDRVYRTKSYMSGGPQPGQIGTVIDKFCLTPETVWVCFDEMICDPTHTREPYLWPCFESRLELVDLEPREELAPISLEGIL